MTEAHIKEVLNHLGNLPAPVKKWEVDTGLDATGEDAVWVWAVLDDENLSRTIRNQLRDRVRDAVRLEAKDPALWVYVRFRAASEV